MIRQFWKLKRSKNLKKSGGSSTSTIRGGRLRTENGSKKLKEKSRGSNLRTKLSKTHDRNANSKRRR